MENYNRRNKMRFIHMADMHFDSPFTVLSSREELGELRRQNREKYLKKLLIK